MTTCVYICDAIPRQKIVSGLCTESEKKHEKIHDTYLWFFK